MKQRLRLLILAPILGGILSGAAAAADGPPPPPPLASSSDIRTETSAVLAGPNGESVAVPSSNIVLANSTVDRVAVVPGRFAPLAILTQRTDTYTVRIPTAVLKQYDLPGNGIVAAAGGPEQATETEWDSSFGVEALIEMTYYEMEDGAHDYIRVTHYRGAWRRSDPSLSIYDAHLDSICFGAFYSGGFCLWQQTTQNIGVPTAGVYTSWGPSYYVYPSWASEFVEVVDMPGGYPDWMQCGKSRSWIYRVNPNDAWEINLNVCKLEV